MGRCEEPGRAEAYVRNRITTTSGASSAAAWNPAVTRRAMSVGDTCLFYHSSCKTIGVVGLATVARTAYPEPGADAKYQCVDLRFAAKWGACVPLDELKGHGGDGGALAGLALLRQPRLSVQPVSRGHYDFILGLGQDEC